MFCLSTLFSNFFIYFFPAFYSPGRRRFLFGACQNRLLFLDFFLFFSYNLKSQLIQLFLVYRRRRFCHKI